LEIAKEAITPSWTHGMILEAIDKDDTYFIILNTEKNATNTSTFNSTQTVGFAVIRQVDTDGEILQIAVDKNVRNSGFGSKLLQNILTYAQKSGFKSVFLEVRKSNLPAIKLYKKHGFTIQRTRKNYYSEPVEDAYVMCRHVQDNDK
jgi:ribosomal-protein-alanine N-acetyltransferase